jgi:hypothetical protein
MSKLEKSPEPQMVRLRSFSGPTGRLAADLARNILETQDIPSVVAGEVAMPGVDMIQLLVREEDAEQAAEILRSYLDTPAAPIQ